MKGLGWRCGCYQCVSQAVLHVPLLRRNKVEDPISFPSIVAMLTKIEFLKSQFTCLLFCCLDVKVCLDMFL